MDWQFLSGTGIAVAFFFLQYAVKDMPPAVTWAGICVGVLLGVWGLVPSHDRMPMGPVLILIASLGGGIGGGVWWWDYRHTTERTGQFAGLTNAQLRVRTVALAEQMREAETDFHKNMLPALLRVPGAGMTEDQLRAYHAARNADLIRTGEDYQLRLKDDVLPEAREIRAELLQRLRPDVPAPRGGNPEVFLDRGLIAGPSPVSDAADYLEVLARALP